MITKEQFDNLKIGDVIVDSTSGDELTIVDRLINILFAEDDYELISYYSFNELNRHNYLIKQSPKHLYGIPYGDYSDKEVYVLVSSISLEYCNMQKGYMTMLLKVDENGFLTYKYGFLPFAKVISNNVKLISYE